MTTPENGRGSAQQPALVVVAHPADADFMAAGTMAKLKLPGSRTCWGLLTRLGAKVAALNVAVYINQLLDRPAFSLTNPISA